MDAIDIKERMSEDERLAFVDWLEQNGRVRKGHGDYVYTSDVNFPEPMVVDGLPVDARIVRDAKDKRIEFALLIPGDVDKNRDWAVKRVSIDLDHEPTPFPAELDKWRVAN